MHRIKVYVLSLISTTTFTNTHYETTSRLTQNRQTTLEAREENS